MAVINNGSYTLSGKKKRPGIHSKTKSSRSKKSSNYKKSYRGQGK